MKILTSKAGVTVLEGVIALGLLAVVTAGAFGVLLSAARKSTQPDMREEMVLAIEKAKDLLQMYTGGMDAVPANYAKGLCSDVEDDAPLQAGVGAHNIRCMLPSICDQGNSSHFTYEVADSATFEHHVASADLEQAPKTLKITFDIACNGYEL